MASFSGSLQEFASKGDHTWVKDLTCDSEAVQHNPNKVSRQVKSGHYVPLFPTPLPDPTLVIYSKAMATELGLSDEACKSTEFARYFSGDMSVFSSVTSLEYTKDPLNSGLPLLSWCTPYALSIMGTPYYNNCPFGNGNGYGDGRAISIGEVLVETSTLTNSENKHGIDFYADDVSKSAAYPLYTLNKGRVVSSEGEEVTSSARWEMQLKGAGATPFCRGADGRAVLRSSIREFIASEAMHHLGVPTTRALSLVQSNSEKARRGWYSGQVDGELTVNDPRLAHIPAEKRQMIVDRHNKENNGNPDVAIFEKCANTCRVSPSFTRIGHVDLFARRYRAKLKSKGMDASKEKAQLEDIVLHAIRREYPYLISESQRHAITDSTRNQPMKDVELTSELLTAFLDASAQRLASLTANWLRVGFAQGNFNADNCLLGGRTMDYGPFGYMEEYNPLFAKWTGSGDHFGFINQPQAGFVNWQVLVQSVSLLFKPPSQLEQAGGDEDGVESYNIQDQIEDVLELGMVHFVQAIRNVWRKKLGFEVLETTITEEDHPSVDLFSRLDTLMTRSRCDYTIFFRELATIIDLTVGESDDWSPSSTEIFSNNAQLVDPLRRALSSTSSVVIGGDVVTDKEFADWLRDWLSALEKENQLLNKSNASSTSDSMNHGKVVAQRLRSTNPKYVAREWMLVEAYNQANQGNFGGVERLHEVLSLPYEEQSQEISAHFYRRNFEVEKTPGVAFMT